MQCLLGVRFSGDRTPCAGGGGARPAERRHEGNEGVADREAAGFRRKGESARRLAGSRSEEHTSELQSHSDLVCRLLLEKKKNKEDEPDPAQKNKDIDDNTIAIMTAQELHQSELPSATY